MPRKGDFIDVPKMSCQFCGGEIASRYFNKIGKKAGHSRGPKRPGPMTGTMYCSRYCMNRVRNAGGFLDRHGYVVLFSTPSQIYEHRLEMERLLGRELTKKETVHHKNGNRSDNRPENLELWESRHGRGQRVSDAEPHWLPIYGAAMTLF